MTAYIGLIITLFVLSMICERIGDFLKSFLSEASSGTGAYFRRLFGIGNLLSKGSADSLEENRRAFRILKINLSCGFITAWALHANLFEIVKAKDMAFETIGWENIQFISIFEWFRHDNIIHGITFVLGCLATGFFISFGSKFWHDLLDIIYQTKNYKRILADPETYKIDNIRDFDQQIAIYPSSYIDKAFLEAKAHFSTIQGVSAIVLKHNAQGYYIEVSSRQQLSSVSSVYPYRLENNTQVSIPVVYQIRPSAVSIQSSNLGDSIFPTGQPQYFGTMGCIVQSIDGDIGIKHLLTCCHNVVRPIQNIKPGSNGIKASAGNLKELGTVTHAVWDDEVDAAIVRLNPGAIKELYNIVPSLGTPQKPVDVGTDDVKNKKDVYLFGAESKSSSGKITGIMADVDIEYIKGEPEHRLINLIVAANNGKAISNNGDSGSCVLDSKNNIVGLIVAGNEYESYIMPIRTLLKKLSVEITSI